MQFLTASAQETSSSQPFCKADSSGIATHPKSAPTSLSCLSVQLSESGGGALINVWKHKKEGAFNDGNDFLYSSVVYADDKTGDFTVATQPGPQPFAALVVRPSACACALPC